MTALHTLSTDIQLGVYLVAGFLLWVALRGKLVDATVDTVTIHNYVRILRAFDAVYWLVTTAAVAFLLYARCGGL